MEEIDGNIWDYWKPETKEYIAIPTNGFVKKDGYAVMGRGLAFEATRRITRIAKKVGAKILARGNVPFLFPEYGIVTFPVKPIKMKMRKKIDLQKILPDKRDQFQVGNWVPGFLCKAQKGLIHESAKILRKMADCRVEKVYVPMVGCGNGGLYWSDVKPILEHAFNGDERFVIIKWWDESDENQD